MAYELAEPKFRAPEELSSEQLTDPDYAKKQLEKAQWGQTRYNL